MPQLLTKPSLHFCAQRLCRNPARMIAISGTAETGFGWGSEESARISAAFSAVSIHGCFAETRWRPEPESNRRIRICSPLRHHSAIGPRAERRGRYVAGRAGCWTAPLVRGFGGLVKDSPRPTPFRTHFRAVRGWRHSRGQLCATQRRAMLY